MKCPLCSREQDADAVFCTACGKKIPRCPACGTVLYKRSRFCVVDGTPLPENLFAGFPPEPEQAPAAPRTAGSAAPPARPVPPERRKKSRLSLVLLLLLLFLLATAALAFFLFRQGLPPFSQEPDQTIASGDEDEEDGGDWDGLPEENPDEEPAEDEENPTEDVPEVIPAGPPSEESEPEPAPAVSMTAITSVDASSYLSESQYSLYHTPDRIMDGDLATAWVEDGTGEGIDESITFTFDSVYLVSGMCIHAGYQKSAELYEKNARPASLTILFSSGETQTVTLQDVNGPQDIVFPAPVETASITLVISSVYSGSKYTDTAVSEISFY